MMGTPPAPRGWPLFRLGACTVVVFATATASCGRAAGTNFTDEELVSASPPAAAADAAAAVAARQQPPDELSPSPDCHQPAPAPRCSRGFCRIEAGCFVMGAPRTEAAIARYADRQVQVTLTRDYWLAQTEVTRKQWLASGLPLPKPRAVGEEPSRCLDAECPVGNVSFFDAVTYANRLSRRDGLPPCYALSDCRGAVGSGLTCHTVKSVPADIHACLGYRLPTEAEWEFAARGGTATAFFTGGLTRRSDSNCQAEPSLDPIGWYCNNARETAHRVGQKRANAWGLFDISGNVAEWCNDRKDPAGYGTGPHVDPVWPPGHSGDLTATVRNPYRISRGGSYLWPASVAKVSWRVGLPDEAAGGNVGLRLARTAANQHP